MSERLTFVQLVSTIQSANQTLALQAKVAVNTSLTLRNWLIGYFIDEYELRGSDRADYGEGLLKALAKSLQQTQLSGVGRRQLYSYLTFYRVYPQIVRTASALFALEAIAPEPLFEKVRTLSAQSFSGQPNLLKLFSYSHFEQLISLDSPEKRAFYEQQCLRAGWSVRELKRQIATLYYERTALSTNKDELERQTLDKAELESNQFPIRDPYIFEFLGIKAAEVMGESELEDALLDKLQEFMLELGHGFCFEARQKRLLIGDSHNFVDLVLYHRILKCHVLVELKVDKFTH